MPKTLENKGFACPKNVQKKLKKKLTSPRYFVIFKPHTVTTEQKTGKHMRTKTLLIASAALAAGILTSSAQTYSQNIVGYTTTPLIGGLNLVCPTVQVTSSNNAEQVFTCLTSGDQLFIWKTDGSGFNIAYYNGPADWYDGISFASIPAPLLSLGAGVYYQNNSGNTETNTFAGTVVLGNTNTLIGGLNMVGSTPPIAGSADTSNTNMALPLVSGDQLFLWKTDGSGFSIAYYNGPGDWYDGISFASIPAPNLTVGGGFYYQNNSGGTLHWTQNLVVP
jgi:hypothetical protein